MRMGEKERVGNGDKEGKNQAGAAGSHAARLHATFEHGKDDHQEDKETMQQDFGVRKGHPEAVGAKGPNLGVTSQKEEDRKSQKDERPIARPREISGLRDECQKSDCQNDDTGPVESVF